MATVYFVGDDSKTNRFKSFGFREIIDQIKPILKIALDTETNVVKSILERKLKVVSVGWGFGSKIAVFDYDALTIPEQAELLMTIRPKKCIIHSVAFDYSIFKKYGCRIENVVDTYLQEQILTNGLKRDAGYHGLQAIMLRRFDMDISKAEQLTFDSRPFTDEQIQYAAVDVLKLEEIDAQQKSEMLNDDKFMDHHKHKGLRKTAWWENEFVKVAADMEMTGIRLDKQKWYSISEVDMQPIYDQQLTKINEIAVRCFKPELIQFGYYNDKDTIVEPIWTSPTKKLELLREFFPTLEKSSAVEIKKYLQFNDITFPKELENKLNGKAWEAHEYPKSLNNRYALLKLLLLETKDNKAKLHKALEQLLMIHCRDYLIDQGWMVPKDTLTLNWASPVQRLKVFKLIDHTIDSTAAEIIEKFADKHELIIQYLEWSQANYNLNNFGTEFYDKHVDLDGKHRTRYHLIKSTGRLSTTDPNILNIPRKRDVFRQAVIPDPGRDFINADYDGQELFITAILSQEPSWLEAINNGYDLHSRNAELVYGKKWKDGAEPECQYYALDENGAHKYHKCECKEHKRLRDHAKTMGFGMLYGISAISLAFRLDISREEAQMLIDTFFKKLPNVRKMMDRFGNFALQHGRIIDPVFGRSRYFEKWKLAVREEHAGIIRQAYNYPIQCSGSSLLKIALVLLRRWINHNSLQGKVQILMPYHDEVSIQSYPEYTKRAKEALQSKMMLAASLAGYKGLKASAKSGTSWFDTH